MLALLVLHHAKLLASNQSILALGVAPMRVVSRWCRCVVQRLCATDCKHPCLVRAAAPHSAPAWMPGVYAQGLCKDAKPTKHTQPFTPGKWLGDSARMPRWNAQRLCRTQSPQSVLKWIENSHYFIKSDFFSKLICYRL